MLRYVNSNMTQLAPATSPATVNPRVQMAVEASIGTATEAFSPSLLLYDAHDNLFG